MIAVIVVLVVVFGTGIFLAIRSRSADAALAPKPQIGKDSGDHWHAFLGVNVCGTWLSNAPEFSFPDERDSIHSHGDGLIHIHPFSTAYSGKNATVGKFIKGGGWTLSADRMKLWDNVEHKNGQDCPAGSNYQPLIDAAAAATSTTVADQVPPSTPTTPTTPTPPASSAAQPAFLVWTVNGKPMTGNPTSYRPKNGDIIAIGFLPKGVPLPEPPGARAAIAQATAGLLPDQAGASGAGGGVAGSGLPVGPVPVSNNP